MTKTLIEIKTSCGETFALAVSDMTDRQLRGLLEQNQDRDVDPTAIAAMRAELDRRINDRA